MKNFDTELDIQGVTKIVTVSETVTVTPIKPRTSAMAYVGKSDHEWQWNDLRDYVVYEIEKRYGRFTSTATKEFGIFNSFMKRWGLKAPAIARYAFEVCGGQWRGRPVHIEDFCRNSDPHFAQPIADRLV